MQWEPVLNHSIRKQIINISDQIEDTKTKNQRDLSLKDETK